MMKNCFIMGFGRSGTSLMGGILHQAGYYMGKDLYPGRNSNPKGFFENAFINGINEKILRYYDYNLSHPFHPYHDNKPSPYQPGEGHRWLTYIPYDIKITMGLKEVESDILEAVSYPGFAYKDPRFNYTLDIWAPFLKDDTLLLCLFRHPSITIQSTLTECAAADYLTGFWITQELAEKLWINSYQHLFRNLTRFSPDQILFIHYHQLLSGEILPYLSDKLGIHLSGNFISPELNRTKTNLQTNREAKQIYLKLCEFANFQVNSNNFDVF